MAAANAPGNIEKGGQVFKSTQEDLIEAAGLGSMAEAAEKRQKATAVRRLAGQVVKMKG